MNKIVASNVLPDHPRSLYILFFTEMWERFSFYGMKALLLAYMVSELQFDERKGYSLLGTYTALVYTMPLIGGLLADRYLGYSKSVIFGGILMVVGHLVLALPTEWGFFYGMAFVICGNGFFKPNVSSMVGGLYSKSDPRRDSGFSLFYLGINLGAALGGLLCGYVGQRIQWHYGFGLAAIFMILGLTVFCLGKKRLPEHVVSANKIKQSESLSSILRVDYLIYTGTLLLAPLFVEVFKMYAMTDYLLTTLGVASIACITIIAIKLDKTALFKLLAAMVMIVFSILFWAFYEQNSGSLNLFAIRNVDMKVMGVTISALSVNNFLPPAWVIVLSFVFARLWPWLNKRNKEPSTAGKFALSFFFLSVGFFVFWIGCKMNVRTGLLPLWQFVGGYFFIVCGELCLSPIGLSMVTKLSPPRMVALMMGVWFFATAIGEFFASKIGAMMSVPHLDQKSPTASMPYYEGILLRIFFAAVVTGVVLWVSVPTLKKWMSDTK